MTQLYDDCMRPAGIEASQFGLLSLLERAAGASQASICRILAIDKTTLSRNLKLLRSKGWIEPAPASDARQRGFALTPEGRERLEAAKPHWREAQERLRKQMGTSGWDAMWTSLQTLAQAAQNAG